MATESLPSTAPMHHRRSHLRRRNLMGYVYISPWILGFLFFVAIPLIASFYLSLTQYAIITPPKFIGLENYRTALFDDEVFWGSVKRTAVYAVLNVVFGLAGSLVSATLLNQGLKGTVLLRTLYYLPSLTPIVASALLWSWIYQPEIGVLNYILWGIGIEGPRWLQSTTWAIPSLVIMALWTGVGGSRMIIFLAGLQGVPQEMYDASSVDGANFWHRFWHVTVPLISPVVFFNMVLMIISSFRVFSVAFIATGGGPAYATYFYVYHLFQNAFAYMSMGYASALAWIFFAMMLVFTYIQFRGSARWVYYGGEVEDNGK